MRWLIFFIALLMPLAGSAADWLKFCGSNRVTTGLAVGEWACYIPTTATDHSGSTLSTGACENIDLLYFNNTDADATIGTVTAGVRSCPTVTADTAFTNPQCWLIENMTLTGTTPSEAIYGAAAQWIEFEAGGALNDGVTQKLLVRCNGSLR
jgi:hypothetical protein